MHQRHVVHLILFQNIQIAHGIGVECLHIGVALLIIVAVEAEPQVGAADDAPPG